MHAFLKKCCLSGLSAGVILSVVESSRVAKLGGSWVGDV